MYTLSIYIGDSERAVWLTRSKTIPTREIVDDCMQAYETEYPNQSMDVVRCVFEDCPFPPVNSTRHICNNGESVARVILKKD